MAKKALLVGINYVGTNNELGGCYNDVCDMRDWLVGQGYSIVLLTDADNGVSKSPTRDNILSACKDLVSGASAGDKLYFHYSGHGSSVKDTSGDERDGADETICPIDSVSNGIDESKFIIDDELYNVLVRDLPADVKLRVVFDSCHSGSALDLPHRWVGSSIIAGDFKFEYYTENNNTPVANVISISGCKDNQTSADNIIGGRDNGALTRAYLQLLKTMAQKPLSWKKFIAKLHTNMKSYKQVPQLSSSLFGILDANVDI